jgi:hypothetical protein
MKWWQLHPIIAPYPPEWIHEEKSRKDAKEWMNMATDHIEQLEREKASWKGAYDGAVLALTERNKELEAALRQCADQHAAIWSMAMKEQKHGESINPYSLALISSAANEAARATLGEKKDD